MIYVLPQDDIVANVRTRVRDTAAAQWTDIEIYHALNDALSEWGRRVPVPLTYEPGDWPNAFYVTLPTWMEPRYIHLEVDFGSGTSEWRPVPETHLSAPSPGNYRLHVTRSGLTGLAYRLGYYLFNGPVPTTLPTLNTTLTDSATSVVIDGALDVAYGGVVEIDSEWILYQGIARTATTTTLQNCTRGHQLTVAAAHTSGQSVKWCVLVPDTELLRQLYDQIMLGLHEMVLHNTAPQGRDLHERMVTYYQSRVNVFWQSWAAPVTADWEIAIPDGFADSLSYDRYDTDSGRY